MPFERPLFILGTTLSAGTAGAILGYSFVGMPPLFYARDDNLLLIQWRQLFERGQAYMPVFGLSSALCYFANAYNIYHPKAPERTYKFIGAGLLTLGIVPFTLTVIAGVNKTLFAMEESGRKAQGKNDSTAEVFDDWGMARDTEARGLLKRWTFLNTIRALFPLAGTLVAFDAL